MGSGMAAFSVWSSSCISAGPMDFSLPFVVANVFLCTLSQRLYWRLWAKFCWRTYALVWEVCYLTGELSHSSERKLTFLLNVAIPSPGDLPNPGIEPGSLELQVDCLTVWATREAPKVRGGAIMPEQLCQNKDPRQPEITVTLQIGEGKHSALSEAYCSSYSSWSYSDFPSLSLSPR